MAQNLPVGSIMIYQDFEDSFKDKWEDKKNPNQYFSQYHSMWRREEGDRRKDKEPKQPSSSNS